MKGKLQILLGVLSALFFVLLFLVKTGNYYGVLGKLLAFCLAFFSDIVSSPIRLILGFFILFFILGGFLTLIELSKGLILSFSLKRKKLALEQVSREAREIIKELSLEDCVVVFHSKKPFAKVLGLFSAKIYISTALFDILKKEELKAVLLHEYSHIKDKDNLWRIFFFSISHSTPFFMILKPLFDWYKSLQEIKSDDYAAGVLKTKKPILLALRKLILYSQKDLFSSYTSEIETRMSGRAGRRKFGFAILIVIIMLVLVFTLPTKADERQKGPCVRGTACWEHCGSL